MRPSQVEDFELIVLAVNGIVAVVAATVLLLSLPPRAKVFLRQGGRFCDCWIGLLVVIVVALLPTNLLIFFVNGLLIPVPLATKAVEILATEGAEAGNVRESVQAVRDQHEEWFVQRGGTSEDAQQAQTMLWESWPIIVIGGIFLTLAQIWALGRFYSQLVSDLARQSTMPEWEREIDQLLKKSARSSWT